MKHHKSNDDLRAQLEAARSLAAGSPDSSAPQEVLNHAMARVSRLKGLLREAEERFTRQPGQPSREILEIKDTLADACDVARQAEELVRPADENEADKRP